ncbi:hypothetical protein CYLTODRAFT_97946 [Cylindrobasidium torrendii FP15055 ss-10]|uniref:Arrestin-like N-terminal domain-containing protein n=1 Tax=Cylindrobasidium torrendii FP15055 ss-10 TaxID=1314674 RepID=A0A0D7BQC9_9AGAR|nr:hypothetical protein CYLTODRAFT_97946 [Cylindrobasidium torrendii FP15055 ss-10]
MSPSSTPWSYTTNCMLVSLGSRQPGELRPCYGRGASVDGQIKCIGNPVQIKRLSVHVEATLSTSDPHPGAHGRSQCATPLFSRSMTLYDGSQGFAWDAVHRFRLPIPDFLEIEGYGHTFPTPPSFSFWDCGAGCDISYQVTVSMVRKRCGFDYNESCVVDILYLPKTRASKGQYPVWIDSSKKDVSDMTPRFQQARASVSRCALFHHQIQLGTVDLPALACRAV